MASGNLFIHRELADAGRFSPVRTTINGVKQRRLLSGILAIGTDPGDKDLVFEATGCEPALLTTEVPEDGVVLVQVRVLAGTRWRISATATTHVSRDTALRHVEPRPSFSWHRRWSSYFLVVSIVALIAFGEPWYQILLIALSTVAILASWYTRLRANRIVGFIDLREDPGSKADAHDRLVGIGETIVHSGVGSLGVTESEMSRPASHLESAQVDIPAVYIRRVASTPGAEAAIEVDIDGAEPARLTLKCPVALIKTSAVNPVARFSVPGFETLERGIAPETGAEIPVLDVWIDLVRVGHFRCEPELRAGDGLSSPNGDAPGPSILTVGARPTLSSVRAAFPGSGRLTVAILVLVAGVTALAALVSQQPSGDWVESAYLLSMLATAAGLADAVRSWQIRRDHDA